MKKERIASRMKYEIEQFGLINCQEFQLKLYDFIEEQKIDKVGIIISALYLQILALANDNGITDMELGKLMITLKKIFINMDRVDKSQQE